MTTVIRTDGFAITRRHSTQLPVGHVRQSSKPVFASVPFMDMSINTNSIGMIREKAHRLVTLGYHLVPCEPGGKRPLIRWASSPSGHAEVERWFAQFGGHINIAIHAGKSRIIVLDADTPEATTWIIMNCPDTPLWASTPRGQHAYFRASVDVPQSAQNLFGIGLDLKSRTSLILASPSLSLDHHRRWQWIGPVLAPDELPTIDTAIFRPRPMSVSVPSSAGRLARPPPIARIRDVSRWIMAVESIQGQGGSNQCFRVACRLCESGLSFSESWHWLTLWNTRKASPPWSEAELIHKLRDAFARVRREN